MAPEKRIMETLSNDPRHRSNRLWKLRHPELVAQSQVKIYVKLHRPKPRSEKPLCRSANFYRAQVLGIDPHTPDDLIDQYWVAFKAKCYQLMEEKLLIQRDVRQEALTAVRSTIDPQYLKGTPNE